MTNDTFPPEAAEGGVAPTIGRAADDVRNKGAAPDRADKPDSPDGAEIAALCADLAGALVRPDYGTDTLRRQAQLLDHLLYSVMARKIDGGGDAWIDLALKIQKQCMDTIKAISAIDYMQAITAPRPNVQHGSQNGLQNSLGGEMPDPPPPTPANPGTNYKGGAVNGAALDAGRTGETGGGGTEMEAVDALDWAEKRGRESGGQPQCHEARDGERGDRGAAPYPALAAEVS